jgi:DNA processing protein
MATSLHASLLILRLPDTATAGYWKLVDTFGSPAAALQQPLSRLESLLRPQAIEALAEYRDKPEQSQVGQRVAADLAYLAGHPEVQCISLDNPAYPELLRQIPKPPPLLYIRGALECLSLPQLALVGSRNPSSGGAENARQFASYLAARGFAITSGLALGIDAAAHWGALDVTGKTLAVLGTGIDLIYPNRHRQLAQQILDSGGALVSEFPLGTSSHAANFPQRNRIISGLSLGTLVVEAAVQSGSLITASCALQQNREVFAIPGSIHNPLARGCHQLIRQGATLVETAQDILDQLDGLLSFKARELRVLAPKQVEVDFTPQPPILDAVESRLLDAIGHDPVSMDLLIERSQMAVGQVASCLMGLEIKGVVQQTERGFVRAS